MAGLYGFFFLSGCVVAGTVRLKWWGGGPFLLLSLLSVFPGGLMSVVGFLCYILRFPSVNLWFFRAVLVLKVIDFQ
jgi:hypothetical protein